VDVVVDIVTVFDMILPLLFIVILLFDHSLLSQRVRVVNESCVFCCCCCCCCFVATGRSVKKILQGKKENGIR
jgi:streptolysin S family bacteriocin protoxin